ncbi:MAG: VacB/RNase II family 3'-5' exoribonuclease [Chlamydiota bacterium]
MKKKPKTYAENLANDLVKTFTKVFTDPSYTPLAKTDLYTLCNLTAPQKKIAQEVLQKLEQEELILIKGSTLHLKKARGEPFKGVLRMNPRGFGFVISDNPKHYPEDAFIAKNYLGGAVDGDTVEVELFLEKKIDKGPEGKIIHIHQRGRSQFAALVHIIEPSGTVIFYSPLLGLNKLIQSIAPTKKPLSYGDRVILQVIDWGDKTRPILCEVKSILGSISDASIDNIAAAEEFNIPKEFSASVIKQAKIFGDKVQKSDLKDRQDLTKIECFTVDPTTAKDFDDALSLHKDEEGYYHLGVHIADVAHYVTPGTPLDTEASVRSNSTYFPGSCIPMLPEELSNNLCSLKPKVVRLCVSVLMTFTPTGELSHHQIKRTYIKSAKRFSYEEAKLVLDGKKKSKHLPTLRLMVELCLLLKKKRNARGSIDFSLPEVVLELDPQGEPTSFKIIEYDITHQMVEEYMLKANEVVAKSLQDKNIPLIFRVHEEPSAESKEDFYALARTLGFHLSGTPTVLEIQKLFEDIKMTPYAQQLSIAFIRSMRLAIYSSQNIGHYGLSLQEYCHFTSPIRRYPDLIIQRVLFGEHSPEENLEAIAQRCSDKERVSFKAEQSVKTLKKLRFLKRWFDEDPSREYICHITKIRPFALSFELSPISVEGSLHVSEIHGDYFIYEPEKNSFVGRRTNIRFCIGDPIRMRLCSVDLVLLESKWERVLENGSLSDFKSSKKTKDKKRRQSRSKNKPRRDS